MVTLKRLINIFAELTSQQEAALSRLKRVTRPEKRPMYNLEHIKDLIANNKFGMGDAIFAYQFFNKGKLSKNDMYEIHDYLRENMPGEVELRVIAKDYNEDLKELLEDAVNVFRVVKVYGVDLGVGMYMGEV